MGKAFWHNNIKYYLIEVITGGGSADCFFFYKYNYTHISFVISAKRLIS